MAPIWPFLIPAGIELADRIGLMDALGLGDDRDYSPQEQRNMQSQSEYNTLSMDIAKDRYARERHYMPAASDAVFEYANRMSNQKRPTLWGRGIFEPKFQQQQGQSIQPGQSRFQYSNAPDLTDYERELATTSMDSGGLVATDDEQLAENRSGSGELIDPLTGQTIWNPDSDGIMPDDGYGPPPGGYVTRNGQQLDGSVLTSDDIQNATDERRGSEARANHGMAGLWRQMQDEQRALGRPGADVDDPNEEYRADQEVVKYADYAGDESVQAAIAAALVPGSGQEIVHQGDDTFAIVDAYGNVIILFNKSDG